MSKPKLEERLQVEKYVRGKNQPYNAWRGGFTYPALDSICTEMVVRFGMLPRWEEWVDARNRRDWPTANSIEKEHMHWKNDVRTWAVDRGICRYRNQVSQLLKYYYAWYRVQYEKRHGKIERTYGRQMG